MFTTTGQETLDYVAFLEKTYGKIFPGGLHKVNRKVGRSFYDNNLQDWTTGGKASWMHEHGKAFLVDDNEEICDEVESCGMRCYRIVTHHDRHSGKLVFAHIGQVLTEISRQLKSDRSFYYVDSRNALESTRQKSHRAKSARS